MLHAKPSKINIFLKRALSLVLCLAMVMGMVIYVAPKAEAAQATPSGNAWYWAGSTQLKALLSNATSSAGFGSYSYADSHFVRFNCNSATDDRNIYLYPYAQGATNITGSAFDKMIIVYKSNYASGSNSAYFYSNTVSISETYHYNGNGMYGNGSLGYIEINFSGYGNRSLRNIRLDVMNDTGSNGKYIDIYGIAFVQTGHSINDAITSIISAAGINWTIDLRVYNDGSWTQGYTHTWNGPNNEYSSANSGWNDEGGYTASNHYRMYKTITTYVLSKNQIRGSSNGPGYIAYASKSGYYATGMKISSQSSGVSGSENTDSNYMYIANNNFHYVGGGSPYIYTQHNFNILFPNTTQIFYVEPDWAGNTYTVTLSKGTGVSSVSGGGSKSAGESVSASASMNTGYHFVNWTGTYTSTSNPYKFTMPASDVTLTANGAANTYTVAYNGNGNTGGSTASSSHTYGTDKALTSNGFSKTGYNFAGWATSQANANAGTVAYTNGQSVSNLSTSHGDTVTLYAVWTAKTYTVTYKNGSTTHDTKTVTYDSNYVLPSSNPSKTGYGFKGWYTSESGGTKVTADTKVAITANQTLYAQWTANQYTVTYKNGSTTHDTKTVTYDSNYVLPSSNPSKTGYSFKGWYTSESGGTKVTADTKVAITANQTLYAQWTANTYTIAFNGNGADGGSTASVPATYDQNATLTANGFTRTGYKFVKWNTKADGTGTDYAADATVKNLTSTANGTFTLYAVWELDQITVTFDPNGGAVTPTSMAFTIGDKFTGMPTPTLTNYAFLGWYTAASGGSLVDENTTVEVGSPTTLYAHWAREYDVTWVAYDADTKTVRTIKTEKHTLETAPVPPYVDVRPGYAEANDHAVVTWSAVTDNENYTIIYTAQYTPNTYTVTFRTDSGSDTSKDPIAYTIESTDKVLPGCSQNGYQFAGWKVDTEYGNTVSGNWDTNAVYAEDASLEGMYGDIQLVATWTPNTYTVVYHSNNGENETITETRTFGVDDYTVPGADTFSKTGYTIEYWSVNETGGGTHWIPGQNPTGNYTSDNGATVDMYAIWKANKYTITFNANGGSPVPEAITYTIEDEIVLPEVSRRGSSFYGWKPASDADEGSWKYKEGFGYSGTVSSGMYGDVTLKARWQSRTAYTITINHDDDSDITLKLDGEVFVEPSEFYGRPYEGIFYEGEEITLEAVGQVDDENGDRFVFLRWSENNDKGTPLTDDFVSTYTFTVDSNRTLYANATPFRYTVYFDGNGATSGAVSSIDPAKYNRELVIPDNTNGFTYLGYKFVSWNTKPDGNGVAVEPGTYNSNNVPKLNLSETHGATVTLYAQWEAREYTVKFDTDGDGDFEDALTETYIIGESVALPTPTKNGHTFKGWKVIGPTTNKGNWADVDYIYDAGTYNQGVNGNPLYGFVELQAVWEANEYTITIYPENQNNMVFVDGYEYTPYTFTGTYGEELTISYDQVSIPHYYGRCAVISDNDSNHSKGYINAPNLADSFTYTFGYSDATVIVQYNATIYNITYKLGDGSVWSHAKDFYDIEGHVWRDSTSNTPITYLRESDSYDRWEVVEADGNWIVGDQYGFGGNGVIGSGKYGNVTLQQRYISYTITFDAAGGTIDTTGTNIKDNGDGTYTMKYTTGPAVSIPMCTLDNYTLFGWRVTAYHGDKGNWGDIGQYSIKGGSTTATDKYGNLTLTAEWGFTVTYDANGAAGTVPDPKTYAPDSEVLTPTADGLARSKVQLLGWSTDPNWTEGSANLHKAGVAIRGIKKNVTLYAIWGYTLAFDSNGGVPVESIILAFPAGVDKVSVVMPSTTYDTYTLYGWAVNNNNTEKTFTAGNTYSFNADRSADWEKTKADDANKGCYDASTNTLTLYASWGTVYPITLDPNGGQLDNVPSSIDGLILLGDNNTPQYVRVTIPTAIPSRENYGFVGWGWGATANSKAFSAGQSYSVKKDFFDERLSTIYAVWSSHDDIHCFDPNNGYEAYIDTCRGYFGDMIMLSDSGAGVTTSFVPNTNFYAGVGNNGGVYKITVSAGTSTPHVYDNIADYRLDTATRLVIAYRTASITGVTAELDYEGVTAPSAVLTADGAIHYAVIDLSGYYAKGRNLNKFKLAFTGSGDIEIYAIGVCANQDQADFFGTRAVSDWVLAENGYVFTFTGVFDESVDSVYAESQKNTLTKTVPTTHAEIFAWHNTDDETRDPVPFEISAELYWVGDPEKTGYGFLGWDLSSPDYASATDISGNATRYAFTVGLEDGSDPLYKIWYNGEMPKYTFTITALWEALFGTVRLTKPSGFEDDQDFVFTIKGKEDDENTRNISVTVVLNDDDSVEIENVPVGEYTVTEWDNWSWRYSTTITVEESPTGEFTVEAGDEPTDISHNPVKNDPKWLSGDSRIEYVLVNFTGPLPDEEDPE